jgi:hypothetical protein
MKRSRKLGFCIAVATTASLAAGCSDLGSAVGVSSSQSSAPAPAAAGPSGAKTSSKSGVYAVTFGVKGGAGTLGAVQFDASAKGGGHWQGDGAKVDCTNLVKSAMHACNEKGPVLSCGLIDTKGFATPVDVVTCRFASSAPVASGDFSVKTVDASNTASKPVRAQVVVTAVTAR